MPENTTLEAEAESIVTLFNGAKADYAPALEWAAMHTDRNTQKREFVFEAVEYVAPEGLVALRECGRDIRYIEAHQFDGEIVIEIHCAVLGTPVSDEAIAVTGGSR